MLFTVKHPAESADLDAVYDKVVKQKRTSFNRRQFSTVTRKAIISYYTPDEKREIADAARRNEVSMSKFIASAALREARRAFPKPTY